MIDHNSKITIRNARTHNLKNISLDIPHHKLIVITGVSGSGKSSLAFDVIAKEGQRRYFETLPSFAQQFAGKIQKPDVEHIEGLSPVITISQKTTGLNSRSTVGTVSDMYSYLRLLFARFGTTDKNIQLSKSLFSFNSELGKCQQCNGLGKEEKIDSNKLISQPDNSIRNGALAPTLPTGYIMYSQVTIDVLNTVCNAEGFSVDIPWKELSQQEQQVILYGSEKVKVPFGKHSIESRLKWTGIKAKPREEGYYKGMIPIMSDILKRDRNPNILKYVSSVTCTSCGGKRLNAEALSVTIHNYSIDQLLAFELSELNNWFNTHTWHPAAEKLIAKISSQINSLEQLGLGYLTLNRTANSLTGSEIQRIRLANQAHTTLSNVLYVFDEPSIGLHPDENEQVIHLLKKLVNDYNTVIVVEHDLTTIKNSDWIIDIGPKAGINGGSILFNGSLQDYTKATINSPTHYALTQQVHTPILHNSSKNTGAIILSGCYEHNLKHIDVHFQLNQINIVSGKSETGKSSLVKNTLYKLSQNPTDKTIKIKSHNGIEQIDNVILIDQSPIGRTPRSNPATYLGISDHIRDLFAKLPESKEQSFTKSKFSFNNKGGRCETCLGAGKTQIGMHFLGNVDMICGTCGGKRFNDAILQIQYHNLSIADIYKLTIDKALLLFEDHPKIIKGLNLLHRFGLGYLTLGQSSTTLSGGEAQRIKMANELQKKSTGNTLYILDEPSIGLHQYDITNLLYLLNDLKEKGNTIVCIEQDEHIINNADWYIEFGPKSGKNGGQIKYQGLPKKLTNTDIRIEDTPVTPSTSITLKGIQTHLLKNIDVNIPKNKLTVITGLSGSGKSSLAYDTLFAEANSRFSESLSTYSRNYLQLKNNAVIGKATGLTPTIAIRRKKNLNTKRSTVGTATGIYTHFRLLYSRIAQLNGKMLSAQHFSFNHQLGACPNCNGLGQEQTCNPDILIQNPNLSLLNGAFNKNKALDYYTNANGQFIAILKTIAHEQQWDIHKPWNELDDAIKHIIYYGTGSKQWQTTWNFKTKTRTGSQEISAKWIGICNYINDEFNRKRHNKSISNLEALMHDINCHECNGSRLKKELLTTTFQGLNIHELSQLTIQKCYDFIQQHPSESSNTIAATALLKVKPILKTLIELGLGYLSINRNTQTLSGGEFQRITLAGQLASHLYGVTYILDEPTIGLDQKQIATIIHLLQKIIANGNTIVVVEHDENMIKNADYIIELGPASGTNGGQVTYQGDYQTLTRQPDTLTYKLLFEKKTIQPIASINPEVPFGVKNASKHNLKNLDITFQSNTITAITGVSGSGKSSLIKNVLYQSYQSKRPIGCSTYFGFEQFDSIVLIDQQPVSMNSLTTPASYIGIIDHLKTFFSKSTKAKSLGLKKNDFSYHSKTGKCPSCNGYGQLKTSLDFMSDVWIPCDSCNGLRYNNHILDCKINTKSIGDLLLLTIDEAIDFFKDEVFITEKLEFLATIGIGHLKLGQGGNTLSGGEAQRLKLAKELLNSNGSKNLYLFDEPTVGLHYFDILNLAEIFKNLVTNGHSIIFIEHNSTLIDIANYHIQLGPGSGDKGGYLLKH